jgi:EmrB/QacA subfamily drug resistance transporter
LEEINDKIYKNRWWILFAVVMQPFMATLDSSIVNVALPVMSEKLSVSMATIEWVVTSYLITVSASILVFGRLGDMKGKTAIFKWGLLMFVIGSLLCGVSKTLQWLVISRVIQGIGAAATMATNQGIITHVFPAHERGRALGISATFVALGTMVGPPLGGFIVSILSWHYIFLVNVPIGIIIFIMGMKILPRTQTQIKERFDIKGAILFSLSVILLFGSMISGQEVGYNNFFIISAFILSVVSFAAFIMVETKIDSPLLPMDIFKNRLFSISVFCAFISFTAISCTNIIQPFYLQYVLKLSPAVTGLFMMIYPLILSIVAPASGYLSDKIGSELLTFLGLLFTAGGLFLMSTMTQYSTLGIMTLFIGVLSIGNGLFQSPNTSLVMSTVSKDRLGIAGSTNALVRNIGLVFGVSLSTTLLYNRMSYKLGRHVVSYIEGREDVFVYGMKVVYVTAAMICILGALITAKRLYNRKSEVKGLN